jgi:hypothetical protein
MGWLRELMDAAAPAVDGYGELARRVLVHPEWPADSQPRARSLAALFSKLDRGIELEWLADRDAAQRALALVLGCPLETVRRAVAPDEDGAAAHVRFEDLPYARSFELREEPLPPGIPELVRNPAAWGRVWWRAPSGSGRSLTGQWLMARGLARFVRAQRLEDALDRLSAGGPLFIELEQLDAADTLKALPERGVCVAAPCPAPDGGGWLPIESPPLLEVLPALLAWIEARVPRDGAFEASAAEAWLEPPVTDGTLPTLGAVLGAAGLLDARGVREARGKALVQLAESFVNERLEQASIKGSAEAQWLRRHGFGALVKLAESALTSGVVPWERPRSQDEWIALVPAELEKSVDSEWVRWSAARAGGDASLRAVERALRDAPPGAYRLVRALVDARLLAERTPGRLSVAPEFLKHAALAQARHALLRQASPFAWGEALLRPHAAPSVLEALFACVSAEDFHPLAPLAELDVSSHPALVVATEAALTCLGLRALSGAEVPSELLTSLLGEQLGLLVELPFDLPRPRLLAPAPDDACPLALHGVWLLAVLAASEATSDGRLRHPLLCPWSEAGTPAGLLPLLDAIHAALARPEVAARPWAVEAFALAGRLLESAPDEDEDDPDGLEPPPIRASPHPLGRPARLAQALLDRDIPGAWLRGFGEHPLELRALQAACALRRISWPRMAHALWKSWQSNGCPEETELAFAPAGPYRDQLWPHLPPEVLSAVWARWVAADVPWPFECFGASQWATFVDLFAERWRRAPGSAVWRAAFERMDLGHLSQAVEAGGLFEPDPEGAAERLLASACRRYPGWLWTKLRASAAAGDAGTLTLLLRAAPTLLVDELVRVLSEELSRRSTQRAVMDVARAWLHGLLSARRGDFRRVYALFVDLEERLARAERARGL